MELAGGPTAAISRMGPGGSAGAARTLRTLAAGSAFRDHLTEEPFIYCPKAAF